MDNKKIIEYLESKGLNLSLEMPKIYLEEFEVTKKNIESAKKDVLEQVNNFFDDDRNYMIFKKDFENSNVDFIDIVYKIKNIVNEYLEQQVKGGWQEMLEDSFVTTKVDADRHKYKALNMEKLDGYLSYIIDGRIDGYLPEVEEQFNFIKNMSKEEILEFKHCEERINENGEMEVYDFFPVEILEYMNPEYIKDDEFVKEILHTFIVEYPYDRWENNEYYRLANNYDFPIYNVNSNYSNFFHKLTPEQQTKFSSIVGYIEPGLTDIKEWPPYAVVEKLWDDGEYCEILKHIEDEEDIERKDTLESNLKHYIEMLMDDIELMEEDETVEEIIGSDKFEFLTKLYTTEYGRDIIDDEQWKKVLKDNKELLDERMQKKEDINNCQILTPNDRRIAELYFIENKSPKEILAEFEKDGNMQVASVERVGHYIQRIERKIAHYKVQNEISSDTVYRQNPKEDKDLLDDRIRKEAELKKLQDEDKQCDETLAKAEQLEQIQENGNKTSVDD